MNGDLRLIVFDVDGTLVDSQGDILGAMSIAFDRAGLQAPRRDAVLGIVGLSLDVAIPRLAPDAAPDLHARMVDWYKEAYVVLRRERHAALSSPLYPHALETLHKLAERPENLLGVATGKSRRGLDVLLESHGLQGFFVTEQVSDFHPSKPHPSMLRAAMAETGTDPHQAVMIGDTSFDLEMAKSAGMRAIGVSWGYHPTTSLGAADAIVDDFRWLPNCLETIWETQP